MSPYRYDKEVWAWGCTEAPLVTSPGDRHGRRRPGDIALPSLRIGAGGRGGEVPRRMSQRECRWEKSESPKVYSCKTPEAIINSTACSRGWECRDEAGQGTNSIGPNMLVEATWGVEYANGLLPLGGLGRPRLRVFNCPKVECYVSCWNQLVLFPDFSTDRTQEGVLSTHRSLPFSLAPLHRVGLRAGC